MTADEIAKLRELCANATPGPWEEEYDEHDPGHGPVSFFGAGPTVETEQGAILDALFIAVSREALPVALDEIERLSEALGVTLKELKRHSPVCHAEVLGWIVTDLGLDPDAGVSK